jgi:PAS domain S-box-containing protein
MIGKLSVASPPDVASPPVRILMLEDDLLDYELAEARLAKGMLAFEMMRVVTREEFETQLKNHDHDLILADYVLPSFDGISALEIARQLVPDTPFIFVSGTLGEEVAIEMLKRGATDYVLKHRLERLVPAVTRALAEARQRALHRAAVAELRKTESLARLIIDGLRDHALLMLDPDGNVASWNNAALRLLGYHESEMLNQPFSRCYPPEEVERGTPERQLNAARHDGHSTEDHRLLRSDGREIDVTSATAIVFIDDGRELGFSKIIQDITERKRADEALRRSEDELRARATALAEADRRKDEFLAMLAHELRNPLAGINNALSLLQTQELDPQDAADARDIMGRQIGNMRRLIDELLDVARLTRGKIRLQRETVDACRVVRDAVVAVRAQAESRRQRLKAMIPEEPLLLVADSTRLEQIVGNLLSNAVKYTQSGGSIEVELKRVDRLLMLRIEDDGVGMAPEMLSRAFDLFSQADGSLDRSLGGLGIGLTMVKSLVELHGGVVTAESDGLNRGCRFTVSIPIIEVEQREPQPASDDAATAKQSPAERRVMIVEDNVDAARTLSLLIRHWGYDSKVVHDGASAVAAAVEFQPAVVLLDIGLPGMDGFHVAEQMRSQFGDGCPLVVALTGYGRDEDRHRGEEAGIGFYLTKPVETAVLQALLAGI